MLFVIRTSRLFFITSTILLFFSTVWAKTSSDFAQPSTQISFFKSPSSQFASGKSSLEQLSQALVGYAATEKKYYLYKNQKISTRLLKTTTALDLSKSENLHDLGFFLTLKKTSLKFNPNMKSKTVLSLAPQTKFLALGFTNGFIWAEINQQRGYIDISDCISKYDFAKAIYAAHPKTKIKQWFHVKNRYFDQIETLDHLHINISSIEGLFPDPHKAIITIPDQSLPLWTTLEIKTETDADQWYKSSLKGHGIVYWKKNTWLKTQTSNQLTIDQLLKKEISFVSFNPKNPKQAIASANGLYITRNGETWTEIEQFKNYKGPVLFYNEYLIFVGNYKSNDGGQTFENYIQIEKISEAISHIIGFDPKKLQVTKIRTIKPFKVEVDLDIGLRIIKVQTPVYTQEWKVVKI